MYSYGPPHMAGQKQDDQHEHTSSNCVRIRDVVLKTCQRRWMIGRSGVRGAGIFVLVARHDDDEYHSTHLFFLGRAVLPLCRRYNGIWKWYLLVNWIELLIEIFIYYYLLRNWRRILIIEIHIHIWKSCKTSELK